MPVTRTENRPQLIAVPPREYLFHVRRPRDFFRSLGIPSEWGVALIPGIVGVAIMLISVLDSRDDAFPAGRPAAFIAGVVFFLAGLAIFLPSLAEAARRSRFLGAIGVLLMLILIVPPVGLGIHRAFFLPQKGEMPVLSPVGLSLDRDVVHAGGEVVVRFDRPVTVPEGYGSFIGIATPGATVGLNNTWTYISSGATQALLRAPITPGPYEVRYHPHVNAVLSRLPIVVLPNPELTPEAPLDNPPPVERR